jgi:signal transduction histidine kinase/ligand-binding sensor domain-containing protein/DNA-binding response OmpR family regulator
MPNCAWTLIAKLRLCSMVASLIAACSAFAKPAFVHESWTVQNGLPVNSINQIMQSRQGYLWLASFDGLVRFDGARFAVFSSSNTVGLQHQRLVGVAEIDDGRLLLSSDAGVLMLFDPDSATAKILWTSPSGRVPLVRTGPDGEIWISLEPGLGRVRGDRIEAMSQAATAKWQISAINFAVDGQLLLGTRNAGLWQWDEQRDGQNARQLATADQLTVGIVNSIAEDGAGTLWIGGEKGIQLMQADTLRPLRNAGKDWQDVVRFLARQQDGGILISTITGAYRFEAGRLLALDPADPRRIPVQEQVLAADPDWFVSASAVFRRDAPQLGENAARSSAALYRLEDIEAARFSFAYRDRGGSLWLASSGAGLHRMRPVAFSVLSEAQGLSAREVYPLHQSSDGAIWIGTQVAGLNRYQDGRVQRFAKAEGLFDDNIRAIASDASGSLWVGTEKAGLFRRQLDGKFQPQTQAPIADLRARALFLDRDGLLWAGTETGLYRQSAAGAWQRHPASDGLSGCIVRVIRQASDGAMWFGSHRCGVARLLGEQLQRFGPDERDMGGDIGNHVRDIHFTDAHTVLIATEDRGVGRLRLAAAGSAQTAHRVSVRAAHGLLSDGVHQILADGHGWLWMSSNRGIFRVRQADFLALADQLAQGQSASSLAIDSYAEAAGLRSREANGGVQSTALVNKNGELWFATQDGVAIVNPDPERLARLVQLKLESVSSGARRWQADLPLSLPADARNLHIEYTELAQMDAVQTRFRYQLRGYDDDWIDVGTTRSANYTKLPPGDYEFQVQAYSGGAWSADGASLRLSLQPYFTETAAFRALLLLLSVGLLGLAYRARVGWLHAQRRELQHQVSVRTEQLALGKTAAENAGALIAVQAEQLRELDRQKSRFFDDLAHELRTPLTLILGPLRDVQRSTGTAPLAAIDGAIRNSEVLLDLTNQLLDLARLQAGKLRLDRRREDLRALLRTSAERFQPSAISRGIGFRCSAPDAPVWAQVDLRHAGKIIDNLLSNAFKFSPAGAQVTLSLRLDGTDLLGTDWARIEVADTGVGIAPEHLAHVFERFYQTDDFGSRLQPGTGIGLALVHDLTTLHDGRLEVQSAPGVGTTFAVLLPLCEPAAAAALIHEELASAAIASADAVSDAGPEADTNGDSELDRATILLVDDHAELRAHVRAHLAPKYRVVEACDGLEALALARERLPDLVVADISMPLLDGYGLCAQIRSDPELEGLPVILLTARAGLEDRLEGLRATADDFLTKPFDAGELLARIDNLLGMRRRLQRRYAQHAGIKSDAILEAQSALEITAGATSPTESNDDAAYRKRLLALIHARMMDETFKVADLADAMTQDRSHLYRRVQEITGQAPSDLIRAMRLERAAELLHANAGPVGEIAYAVGFSSVAYFTKCFRERYGQTPGQCRGVRVVPIAA